MAKVIYLRKANDDLLSHCDCGDGRITSSPQADCPWCGCGWLFTCIGCRKAFSFAVGVELDMTWEELARADLAGLGLPEISESDVEEWVDDMQGWLADVVPGREYACLDGVLWERDARDVEFEGIYASHRFDRLPHLDVLAGKSAVGDVLGSVEYWQANQLEED